MDKNILFETMRASKIPTGKSGVWTVERSEMKVDYGTTYLYCDGCYIMDDCDGELLLQLDFVSKAEGKILIAGLGLGCTIRGLLATSNKIEKIDVLEISQDVINLVGNTIQDSRVVIHNIDATKDCLDGNWDYAWWDLQSIEMDVNGFKPVQENLMQDYKKKIAY